MATSKFSHIDTDLKKEMSRIKQKIMNQVNTS